MYVSLCSISRATPALKCATLQSRCTPILYHTWPHTLCRPGAHPSYTIHDHIPYTLQARCTPIARHHYIPYMTTSYSSGPIDVLVLRMTADVLVWSTCQLLSYWYNVAMYCVVLACVESPLYSGRAFQSSQRSSPGTRWDNAYRSIDTMRPMDTTA
jgi:hypothetical protein